MRFFDEYMMVDWSAASTPKSGKDSIWWAHGTWRNFREPRVQNPRTRVEAMRQVGEVIRRCLAERRRLLVGFDFPLGYPAGLVTAFPGVFGSGVPWERIWHTWSTRIDDQPNNTNNRWQIAAQVNRETRCTLFWGAPPAAANEFLAVDDKPLAGLATRAQHHLNTFRLAEELAGKQARTPAQPCWKLLYAGSVGSQALLGIPGLQRLREAHDGRVHVWPFETGYSDDPERYASVTLAEIWPTLFHPDLGAHPVRDAAQVIGAVAACAQQDRSGNLGGWLSPQAVRGSVERACEEGWILGLA